MRLSSRHLFAVGVGLALIVVAALIFSDMFQRRPKASGSNEIQESRLPHSAPGDDGSPAGQAVPGLRCRQRLRSLLAGQDFR